MNPPFLQDIYDSTQPRPSKPSEACVAVRIALKVVPGSRKDEVAGMLGERLKIRVSAPPEAGKANAAVCEVLAKVLGVPSRAVSIVAGLTNPEKIARVEGINADDVLQRLAHRT